MSSNAFARSRPRVRHQRVPKTHSFEHPRFLQLVNELTRINEAKKKQEESDPGNCASSCNDLDSNHQSSSGNEGRCDSGCSANNNQTASTRQNIASCCDSNDTFHTLNGYRSLDTNQSSTSALNDNYYQHINNNNNTHLHQQQQHYPYQHQLQIQHQQHYGSQQIGENLPNVNDRCLGKGSSNSFGYSKQNMVVEQQSSDLSNDNPDLRQDENRSKRKRSANDPAMNSKKALSLSSGSGASKKHKSSPEGTRPLSPSFTKCPICLLDSMDRDPSFTNTCFHLFCYVCIENWTKNKATCPLCRTKFTKIIYNIKSATNYEEKIASPIRRVDDDNYVPDRLMLEHFTSLNSNSATSNRNSSGDDVQFLFENLHRNDVLMPQYFVNQIDPRQRESLHSFNTVTTSANFSSNVPQSSFSTSYPIASNYIALFPNPSNTAITTSAYAANTGLTNMNSDPNGRRISRSGRLIYSRPNYEQAAAEVPVRMSRDNIAPQNLQTLPVERAHHHHHPEQHSSHHHHHHQHENRSTLDMSARQNQRMEQQLSMHFPAAFTIQPRQYDPTFARRTYNGSHDQQHILENFYRRMPEM